MLTIFVLDETLTMHDIDTERRTKQNTTKMGMLWHDNLDPNNEVGSCQKIWVDNLVPFWLFHFSRLKNVWVDILSTNGTTSTGDPLTSQTL